MRRHTQHIQSGLGGFIVGLDGCVKQVEAERFRSNGSLGQWPHEPRPRKQTRERDCRWVSQIRSGCWTHGCNHVPDCADATWRGDTSGINEDVVVMARGRRTYDAEQRNCCPQSQEHGGEGRWPTRTGGDEEMVTGPIFVFFKYSEGLKPFLIFQTFFFQG